MRKKIILILLCCCACCTSAYTQDVYFKHYQVESGLSNNSVVCSVQDKNGFLWFGTNNGLNRFDGYSFKIFRHDPEDSTSIGSSFMGCLFEDKDGTIWAGTNKGIYLYNPLSEKFTLFPHSGLKEVSDIKQEKNGKIWLISNSNIFSYDPVSKLTRPYAIDVKPGTASSIAVLEDETVWVSTISGTLKKYVLATDSFITEASLTIPKTGSFVRIEKIYPLTNGNLLIGTLNRGAKTYNVRSKSFTDILDIHGGKNNIFVRDIIKLNEKEYWIGTETGIYIFNPADPSIVHLQKTFDNPYSLSDNVVLTFSRDREGGLWIGTYFGGINYYPKQFTRFEKYFPEYSRPSISGNAVHEICKDHLGNLWVGTEDGGLNKMDPLTKIFTSFKPTGARSAIAYHNIHGLLASGDSLWIGTFMHGLDIMNIKTRKVIRHYDAGPGPGDLKNNFIVTLYKTRTGNILVGTKQGLFRYNPSTDNFSPVPGFNSQIQSLLEDKEGTLWACTRGGGVIFSNARTGAQGVLLYNPKDSNSLANNCINGVFVDSQGMMWFATDGGLCKYEKERNRFTRYTTKNGVPDNLIFRILEDDHLNLFVSTSKGLFSINTADNHLKVFTKSNGLLSDQFNYNSAFKDSSGVMYFGSVKGLISFNPADFRKNKYIAPVYITGLQVNNHDLTAKMKGSSIAGSILNSKEVILPYDESTLSLDFAALSYPVPEMNEYAYKMEGLDKEWTYLKRNRKVYYTKLPPGTYYFNVKGSNSSGVWNPQEASLKIVILPPWWSSIWAEIVYVMVFVALSVFTIKSFLNRQIEKNRRRYERLDIEKEREIYHSKIEFFTNIAHEIRTPLTLIKMPLDNLIRKQNTNAEIKFNLKTMEKNTNRLIDLTNQLLDFRNTEMDKVSLTFVKTDISDLLNETFEGFMLVAEQKGITYKLELPGIGLQAYVDREALKKIFSNLINNAIKYSETKVLVSLKDFSSGDKVFNVLIQNDGYIISNEFRHKIFEPFYRIKETDRQPGNGIGLPLSRSLAELHKGVLDLSECNKNLNSFILTLPIHQDREFKLLKDEPATNTESVFTNNDVTSDSLKPEILLVEDNKEIMSFICKELSGEYQIHKAYDGQEALDFIREGNIRLVISDIMMPVMDGLELCRRIKTNLDYSHIPIILLTAKNSMHAKIEGLEVGADAYIEKPFDLEYLSAQISNLLVNRRIIKEYFVNSPLAHIKSIGYTKADKSFLENLKTVIDENLTNMDIDVEQLAKIMNMSRPTFYRKIKALSNLTPHELIHITRLKKGAELLCQGNFKVYEVADMIGYSLQTNFARDFSKQFGMSPSDYINEKQGKKQFSK